MSDIPILILGYNRLDYLKQNLLRISQFKPKYLYISIDGAKTKEEYKDQLKYKSNIYNLIKWNIKRLDFKLNKVNLGCRYGVIKGITDFFKIYSYGIIIEDDVLIDERFLNFFDQKKNLLFKDSIGHISAYAPWNNLDISNENHVETLRSFCWGWGTTSIIWSKFVNNNEINKNFKSKLPFFKYIRRIELNHRDYENSWAIRWNSFLRSHYCYSIAPKQSMSKNIGIGDLRATHTKKISKENRFFEYLLRSDFFFEISRIFRVLIILIKR